VSVEAKDAFLLMTKWKWVWIYPDGDQIPASQDLDDVSNRLALEGVDDPKSVLLELLCAERLSATGDFRWQKYRRGEFFRLEKYQSQIHVNQWRTLFSAIVEVDRMLSAHEWPWTKVDLEQLQLSDCDMADWKPSEKRFAYALCPPETQLTESDYFEEQFSAWDVSIDPMVRWDGSGWEMSASIEVSESEGQPEHHTHKPRLSDAELNRWWEGKLLVREHLTQEELLTLARLKYPDHHISRERIRELGGPRKTGPKAG